MKRSSSALSHALSPDNVLAEFKTSADAEPVLVVPLGRMAKYRWRPPALAHTRRRAKTPPFTRTVATKILVAKFLAPVSNWKN
jgi:hypothetical protein